MRHLLALIIIASQIGPTSSTSGKITITIPEPVKINPVKDGDVTINEPE